MIILKNQSRVLNLSLLFFLRNGGVGKNKMLNHNVYYMDYINNMIEIKRSNNGSYDSFPILVKDNEGFSKHIVFLLESHGLL